jgi:hypothetical protein
VVTRNRLVSATLLAVLAFGLDVSRGVPTRLTTLARAVWCCSTICHHTHGATAAPRCCGTEHEATELAATPAQKPADGVTAVPAVALQLATSSDASPLRVLDVAPVPASRARAAPVFLLNRSFRI